MRDDVSPVRRRDWRAARRWITQSRVRARWLAGLLAGSGGLSVLGWLRWQQPLARWSFALLCWAAAAVLLSWTVRRGSQRGMPARHP